MEKLKPIIPEIIKRMIADSTPEDLPSTCSSLHEFFLQLPCFHQMIDDLTNPQFSLCSKNWESALGFKRKGNDCFSAGDYSEASKFYSQFSTVGIEATEIPLTVPAIVETISGP
ncbi:hypothetical protein Nepgr_017307 [Nepenthes gracilis]|uniref:Uncharacterized protein n=1 Tax=Nepenthes gracilis TaxID=150966 RepID=A0AAD3XT78_NEPGR|nr:hypothetical protein Nepgr_017307 [Nepenthes gracilis]